MKNRIEEKPLSIRRFLRDEDDEWGSQSTVHISLETDRYERHDDKVGKYGSVEACVTLRDCSDCIAFDFSASKERKHFDKQLSVLKYLIRDLQKLEQEYEVAIASLTDSGHIS